VASVAVTPDRASLAPNANVQLTATPKDASGNNLSGRSVTWASSSDAVATVSQAGLVTAVAAGSATITATSEGKSGTATITVKDGGAVGASGGTVTGLNGKVTLVIPAGAVSQNTNFTIEAARGLPGEPRLVTGTALEIGPTGTNFAQPATLTIKYDPASIPSGSQPDSLALYTVSGGNITAVAGSTVDTGAKTVRAPLSHLSLYGVLTAVRVTRLDVLSRKRRVFLENFDMCAGQSHAIAVFLFDANDGPLDGRIITATSGDPNIATAAQYQNNPGLFFLHGLNPGRATITIKSEAASLDVTAGVANCPRPAVLVGSNQGNFELHRYKSGAFTLLTNNPALDEQGRVSPDGTTIGFQSDRVGGVLKLYLMDLNGANVRPLVTLAGIQRDLAWAPDGTWIAFRGIKPNGKVGIFRVNTNGSGLTLLTNTATAERFPAISADATHIAYDLLDVDGHFHIHVMNPDGNGDKLLTQTPTGDDDTMAWFSPINPGNPEIVFTRQSATNAPLFRIRLDGTRLGQVTNSTGYNFFANFCQDGEQILYTHSGNPTGGPVEVRVQSLFVSNLDEPPFVPVDLKSTYFRAMYYPEPSNTALVYGCKP